MNISKLYKTKKLAFLCAILLRFKAECAKIETGCCDPDLVDTLKSNSRKATPNILSFLSLSLGSSGFLESMTADGGKILGFTGASIGMASTLLNVYNYYIYREQI